MSDDTIPMFWPEVGPRPHPYAAVFRMLVGEERESLAANVADKGLQERVKIYEEKILDGRNRYLVLVDEGVFDPEIETWRDRPELFEEFAGTHEQALDYVWSLNAERRHDTPSQRAIAAERYANLRNITQAEAAAKFGVSERQVNSAAKVLEQAEPEVVQAVEEGRLPLYLAEQVADLDEDDQREIAEQPKREASAVARQKLQDPPPLAQSGPVVKAMDPSSLVMFAAAVFAVGEAGKDVDASTLDALAREHRLLADADGTLNLRQEVRLAFDVARKRTNVGDGDLLGSSLYAVLTAGLHDDLELLIEDYRQAHKLFDQAMRAGEEERAGEAKQMLEALLWHANGKARFGISVNERPKALVQAAVAPLGTAPMWGQNGVFEIEVDGLPALVRYKFDDWGFGPSFTFRATRFDLKFPRGGWAEARARFSDHLGVSVEEAARQSLRRLVEIHTEGKKTTTDDRVGMYYPEFVNRIDPSDTYDQMERVKRGVEIPAGMWPALPKWEVDPLPAATEQDCRDKLNAWKSGKRGFPKPKHLATHILLLTHSEKLKPVADFPAYGAYVYENNGHWYFVDNAEDPSEHAVRGRMVEADADPSLSDADWAAAYLGALASLTEPKGKLHQSTAADALRAGVNAGISRAQMAEDLGHPIGTILNWTHKLKLTGLGEGRSAPRPRAEAAE